MEAAAEPRPASYNRPLDESDLPLLRLILPPEHRHFADDDSALPAINTMVDTGSRTPSQQTPAQEIQQIIQARYDFLRLLGIPSGTGPLAGAHASLISIVSKAKGGTPQETAIPSMTILGSLRAVYDITGDPVTTVSRNPDLLRRSGDKLMDNFQLMTGLAGQLGWNGSVRALVVELPRLFYRSPAYVSLLARLAMQTGRPQDVDMTTDEILRITVQPLESLLLRAATSDTYHFGEYSSRHRDSRILKVGYFRHELLGSLADEASIRRLGGPLVAQYLSYRPPKPGELAEFPHIAGLIPAETKRPAPIPRYLSGNEAWLGTTALVTNGKVSDNRLQKLNKTAHAGSASVKGMKPTDSRHIAVVNARFEFLHQLGWDEPEHPFCPALQRYLDTARTAPNPTVLIDTLNTLSNYIEPAYILTQNCRIFDINPDKIRARIGLVQSNGLDVTAVLRANHRILKKGETELQSWIDRHKQRFLRAA